jgi:hypothetical protein
MALRPIPSSAAKFRVLALANVALRHLLFTLNLDDWAIFGRTRGDADDYNSSCLFRGDIIIDAEPNTARVSSWAKENWTLGRQIAKEICGI